MNPRHPPVNDLPAHQVGVELKRLSWTLAVAESCTGGLVAHRITNMPGSSAYFLGGVVAYANAVKAGVLGVPEPMLAQHGAVSEEVAREMAQGVRQLLQSDVGLAVTGIAGPGGGTPAKPIGLVWIALSSPRGTITAELRLEGDRLQIKGEAAETALRMLNTHLGEGSNATG